MRDDLDDLIGQAAYRTVRRYRGFVEPEDVRQEMWAWVLARKTYVNGLEVPYLGRKLQNVGEAYGRKEKAAKTGYSPSDEFFYSFAVLREMLPVVLAGELPTLKGVNDEDKQSARRAGASTSMEYETVLVDLRKTFNMLPAHHQKALIGFEAGGVAVTRGFQAWQRKLGGRKVQV